MSSRVRALAVAVVLLLAALLPVAPGDAAAKKHFKHVYTCIAVSGSGSSETRGSGIWAFVNLGYFTGDEGSDHPGDACYGGDRFHRSVSKVSVRFRWYVGSKLVRSSKGKADSPKPARVDELKRSLKLRTSGSYCAWYSNGKRVSLTITLAKKGYATKRISTNCFSIPS